MNLPSMTNGFARDVQEIVGPLLFGMGFTLNGVVDDVDEGGRSGSVVYFQGEDCKIQIYYSSREGEINAMIAPIDAPNEHGLYDRSGKWRYLNQFSDEPKLSLEELVRKMQAERANFATTQKWLEWIKTERIMRYFDSAHAAVIADL